MTKRYGCECTWSITFIRVCFKVFLAVCATNGFSYLENPRRVVKFDSVSVSTFMRVPKSNGRCIPELAGIPLIQWPFPTFPPLHLVVWNLREKPCISASQHRRDKSISADKRLFNNGKLCAVIQRKIMALIMSTQDLPHPSKQQHQPNQKKTKGLFFFFPSFPAHTQKDRNFPKREREKTSALEETCLAHENRTFLSS